MTSLRYIEPKSVVKLQPFGTERDMWKKSTMGNNRFNHMLVV